MDTGAVANSDYYIFAIARTDTGVVDYLCSLSSTAPDTTLVPDYNRMRLIGWYKRAGGTVVAFLTFETTGGGLNFIWVVPTTDVSVANGLTTTERTDAVRVPLNVSTIAHVQGGFADNGVAIVRGWLYTPGQTAAAPGNNAAPMHNMSQITNTTVINFSRSMYVRTSATGTLAAICTVATADLYVLSTMGFEWSRRP